MKIELDPNDILGAVITTAGTRVFAAQPYAWALDPSRLLGHPPTSWDGLFRVSPEGEIQLQEHFNAKELSRDDVAEILRSAAPSDLQPWWTVVVDFEKKRFVSGFFDQPIEDYAPASWRSSFDDPYEFIPEELAAWWPAEKPQGSLAPQRPSFFRKMWSMLTGRRKDQTPSAS